jgi:hypothetical protein
MLDEDDFLIFESKSSFFNWSCRILYLPSPKDHRHNARHDNMFYVPLLGVLQKCNASFFTTKKFDCFIQLVGLAFTLHKAGE